MLRSVLNRRAMCMILVLEDRTSVICEKYSSAMLRSRLTISSTCSRLRSSGKMSSDFMKFWSRPFKFPLVPSTSLLTASPCWSFLSWCIADRPSTLDFLSKLDFLELRWELAAPVLDNDVAALRNSGTGLSFCSGSFTSMTSLVTVVSEQQICFRSALTWTNQRHKFGP